MTRRGRVVTVAFGAAVLLVLALLALNWQTIAAQWRFWRLFESIGQNEQGLPEYRHRQTGIVMVQVPGGTFTMGAQSDDRKAPNYDPNGRSPGEEDVHGVTLSAFLIGKHEVTQAQWKRVMGNNPSDFKGGTLPVEKVSWEDCQEFCEKTRLSLPTDAQWEFACRAGQEGPYAGTGNLDDMGWYDRNSGSTTHPVGQKNPNAFGLCDMHGNVMELCEDVYDREFYSKPEATQKDPVCRSGSESRVIRGGNWLGSAKICRSAFRFRSHPSFRRDIVGFRPAYYPLP